MAVTPDGTEVWATADTGNNVTIFSAATNAVIGTITGLPVANAITFSPSGDKAYITNFGAMAAARDLRQFDSLDRKRVRLIRYRGLNKVETIDEIVAIFADMGFTVAEGPDIETDFHNFTALNIPPEHPARQMHDTFYLPPDADGGARVLRTHTSPVQIRTMLKEKPPIRIIAPGRTYRSDSDATHTPMFHQVEGLVIDKGITLGHLKWTLETFLKAFFERDDIVLRLRPSYFPFTEPSAEVDVGYTIEKGKRVIGGSGGGWMEVLGSGMVHPKVIEACGLDPNEWQGFAFGCGIDRLAMLKYGMDDLRAFFDGDIRWLKHYGFASLDVPTLSGGVGA